MRYSPDGQHIAFERDANRIEVCVAATGKVLATFPIGYQPRWIDDTHLIAQHPTGGSDTHTVGQWTLQRIPANRGQVDANGHRAWCVSDLWRTILNDSAGQWQVNDAREPRLSASGALAVRHPATGHVRLVASGTDLGLAEDSRWSSETLCWWLSGRVWGRTTPNLPTVELTVPGRACALPCPFWDGSELWVGLVLDEGELWVTTWGHLTTGTYLGWRVGASGGSAFDWDMRRDGGYLSVCYYTSQGTPVYADLDLAFIPWQSMLKPPTPEPVPDTPWVTDPTGVVEDVAEWIFSRDQGPDVTFSPDGKVRFYLKSDEVSAEGKAQGEHWDEDADYIGHLDDASTGRRIYQGKEVIAEDIVKMFPNDHAAVWASLPLNHNYFKDGARLWMPRRCVSGTSIKYITDITWDVPPRETPHTNVWKNIPIEIRVDVGHAVINGKEVRVRSAYIPDGHEEVSFYGPPKGYNAWIAGPMSWEDAGGTE